VLAGQGRGALCPGGQAGIRCRDGFRREFGAAENALARAALGVKARASRWIFDFSIVRRTA